MEKRLTVRVSRMFRSSFGSCRSKNITDVIENPLFPPQTRQHSQLMAPNPNPPSICKPKDNFSYPRRKISDRNSLLVSTDTCKKPNNTKKKKTHSKDYSRKYENLEFNSSEAAYYYGWSSSNDDDEATLFSSKSLSSDSSSSFRRNKNRRRCNKRVSEETNLLPMEGKVRVKDSFAVVKRSSDPYGDFRTSMVEMIVERQIFAAQDLEELLQCFLSLNSDHHHRVIVQVFTEIWETLFSDCS